MKRFIKTVTKEVVDVEAICNTLSRMSCAPWLNGNIRLVMSDETKQAIKAACKVTSPASTVVTFKDADLFEGCPVDTNNALEFGEVLFTRPV